MLGTGRRYTWRLAAGELFLDHGDTPYPIELCVCVSECVLKLKDVVNTLSLYLQIGTRVHMYIRSAMTQATDFPPARKLAMEHFPVVVQYTNK